MKLAVACLVLALLMPGCAPKRPAAVAPAPVDEPNPLVRLAEADAALRRGCFDCLRDAYQTYESLRQSPIVGYAATMGAIRTAGLIALRERGLGMWDSGHLQRARMLMATDADLEAAFAVPLDIIDTAPSRLGRVIVPEVIAEVDRRAAIRQANRQHWMEQLRAGADADPFSAALWVSFSCANSPSTASRSPEMLMEPLTAQRDAPLVMFEVATCFIVDTAMLGRVVAAEPRFHEADYWLGFRELSGRKLEEAQVLLTRAYEWYPQWPSAAVALAGLFMSAEELGPSLEYYDKALSLQPGLLDALVGRVRALSYLDRNTEAIAGTDAFVGVLPGDAYYFRAWNKNQLAQLDDAWRDVLEAERYGVTADVAKLAGVVAYRRRELDIARDRFEKARRLNAEDCDSHFYLGGVQAELKAWAPSADAYVTATGCLEGARTSLLEEIEKIEASDKPADRKARQIASRQQRIALAERMLRQSWFNLAANYFNIGRTAESRSFAERVVGDEQFGERARALLDQLR